MKRILFLKQDLQPKGGLEKYAKRIVSAFLDYGCSVTVASSTSDIVEFAGVNVHYLPLQGWLGSQKLRSWDEVTKDFIRQYPHDIVFTLDRITSATHIRAGNGVHAAYLQKRQEGVLKRLSFAINPLHRTILRLEKEGFQSPYLRKIIVNSHMVEEEIKHFYGLPADRIAVHHNGVEWKEMGSDFSRWEEMRKDVQKELNIEADVPTFLFAGHHYQRKGLDFLLAGLSQLKEGRLIVIGKDKNLGYYHSLVESLGIQDRVLFLGSRGDMRRFYALSDILVVPSLYDPFANVTLEALAMGLFVVTSKFNGGKEILDEEMGCIIENLLDPVSVAQALQRSLSHLKTPENAEIIRNKVAMRDFSLSLPRLIEECIG